jgi:glycosyltransferase involved in cell wall biosynthesis
MLDVLFVMEQHVGLLAFYQNLRSFVDRSDQIRPAWSQITYVAPSSLWGRLPGLPRGLRGSLVGRSQVRSSLRKYNYQVAFFNTQVPAALAGELVYRKPYVICTDVTPLQYDAMGAVYGHPPDKGGLISKYKHNANLKIFQRAAQVISWSRWAADSIRSDYGVEPDRIQVIPPGVDCEVWQAQSWPQNQPLKILFVGGDWIRKGGEDLLKAYSSLPAGLAELVLVTRAPVEPVPGVSVVSHLTPNSPELRALYRSCDVFVLPTLGETFGIAAVEAAAAGLPVIATPVGGLTDIVVDGETGFIIPPGEPGLLAQRIELLAADPDLRHRMGAAARQRVETIFNARANSHRIVEILLEVAAASLAGQDRRVVGPGVIG